MLGVHCIYLFGGTWVSAIFEAKIITVAFAVVIFMAVAFTVTGYSVALIHTKGKTQAYMFLMKAVRGV